MNKEKSTFEFQSILSVGYIYLLVMGILNETLYFNQLGINVLNYASIQDILISPIAKLTSSITSISVFTVLICIILICPRYLAQKREKEWMKKLLKVDKVMDEKETTTALLNAFLALFALGIFGFYIGTGLGGGYKMSKKINHGEIEYLDRISFISGEQIQAKIVGTNSAYVFYLEEGNNTVKISPINGIIKEIESNK